MSEKTALIPGVFTKTCNPRGLTTIEGIVEKVLIANGYPVMGNTCNQPNICDLLTGCTLPAGAVCTLNGILGDGLEGACIQLGGDLVFDTVINTDTFDFSVTKDNVLLDINDVGGGLGAGETARFLGDNGTLTAEIGVYTNGGGSPTVGMRGSNSSTNFYSQMVHSPLLETLVIKAGDTDEAFSSQVVLDFDSVTLGLTGSSDTNLTVKKFAFTGGTDVIQLINLPIFADNTAAAAASLPVDAVYKTATGELRVRV